VSRAGRESRLRVDSAKSQNAVRQFSDDLQEQLKPPNGGVFLGLNSLSSRAMEASTLRISQTPSISVKK
jgi:hypothetical protein